jgi:iron complex transport system substrate-binding protein
MSHEPRKSAQLFTNATTRRRFIRAAAAVAGAAVVTRAAAQAAAHDASAAASPASGATPATGAWTFTDDKGVTANLPAPPVCIVADVNAVAPL